MAVSTFKFAGSELQVNRMGYGAMRLVAGAMVGGLVPEEKATAVLREAIERGVNHIDTSDFYGPYVVNQAIRKALAPYRSDLVIVTKVGAKIAPNKHPVAAYSKEELTEAIESNRKNLGVDQLDVVNLRVGAPLLPSTYSVTPALEILAEMQAKGWIKHLGLSTITPAQYDEGRKIAPIVCVQNLYNIAKRDDDAFIDRLASEGVAYVPYFPLGGFTPLQSSELSTIAQELKATPMQVALAWLLQRSPNILLIPGTSSVEHLRENIAASDLKLSPEIVSRLNALG